MSVTLTTTALVVVVAAAIRSTWSPCGWSMLSTITPLTERARGHRFAATAGWFGFGSVVGGALLGGVGAVAAIAVRAADAGTDLRLGIAALATMVAAAFDAGTLGPALPHQRRQVNEAWLDEFRPWVYGTGFGLQIGFGLITYIMSAGVYLVVALGALGAGPGWAWLFGVTFGGVRGSAVLLGVRNDTPARLAAFHRRFAAAEAPARAAVTVTLAVAGVVLAVAAAGVPGAVVGSLAAAVLAAATRARRHDRGSMVTAESAPFTRPTSADRRASEPTTA